MTQNRKHSVQQNRFSGNILQGLRSPGLFAKWPIAGTTMFLLGSFTFSLLAYNLRTNEAFLQWDIAVAKTFRTVQTNAPWSLMENILFGCFVGKEVVIMIGTILAVYFLHKRFWRELTMLVAGLGGGGLIWYVLSRYFDRPRPTDHLDVLQLSGPSFPSGPALMAILCYGLLTYLLVPKLPTLFWKWFVVFLSIAAIVLVASSSLLFGTHYVSDVIAGVALGLAWAGIAYPLVERIFRRGMAADQESIRKMIDFQGLRSPGAFKRRPIIGWAVILFAGLSFAALGYNLLAKGPLLQLDQSVYEELLVKARAASPSVNDLMLFGFFIGKQIVQMIVAILSLYFLSQRYWREFGMIQISSQGGGLLMICYGFLAYLLVPKMPSLFWKWVLSMALLAIVLFEGFSRIFHGNHYLTDVLSGYALGIAWIVLVCTLIESIFMRSQEDKE